MTRSSTTRIVRKIQAKKAKKLGWHLETMAAAYTKQTEIPANRSSLVHETKQTKDEDTGLINTQVRYWFEHHEDRAKIVDTHPDIQYLFDLAGELVRAYNEESNEQITEGLVMLKDFLKKFEPEEENGSSEEASANTGT